MRRLRSTFACVAATAFLLAASSAQAAVPTLGSASATNIQGVSALLKASVDPEGLTTTYSFEYGVASNFTGASKTPARPAGSGNSPRPARAAISGLAPSTTYYYRLLATNSSGTVTGTPASFATTQGFGFLPGTQGFAISAIADGGAPATEAGSHPYQLSFKVGLRQGGQSENQPGAVFSDGDVRDLHIEGPPGLIENPAVILQCTLAQFQTPRVSPFEESRSGESCPDKSQVGTVSVETSSGGGSSERFGIFNLAPAPGIPAQLGFSPFGAPIILNAELRPVTGGSYALTFDATNIPQALDLHGLEVTLWGAPWGVSHDAERGNCLNESAPDFPWGKCSVGDPANTPTLAYLTLPHQCSGPLAFTARTNSWQQPGNVTASAVNLKEPGKPAEMGSCSSFEYKPQVAGLLTNNKASTGTGFNFQLTADNKALTSPGLRAATPTKTAVVKLPPGVSINPSVGAGIGVCAPAQYAAETAFSPQGAGCPNASNLGEFTVRTALFEEVLDGAVYLAKSDDPATPTPGAENPFDSLVALYLVAKLPSRGILIKVPGKMVPDPGTGDLTATFDGLPQLPYSELNLKLTQGQRSLLIGPPSCGTATTQIDLTPWAGPGSVHAATNSQITAGIDNGPCPSGAQPFTPQVVAAGGVNSNVNSYTPYFIHLARKDTESEITSYSLELPEGITGKLAGIPYCADAAIEAARSRRGLVEEASPSCPAASQVGHTQSGYGVGNTLAYTSGKIYLAGPYNGRPLSLVTINPATVGPFDLGNVVIRSAFSIDEHTAQLKIDAAASDRIPHILSGVPLHLRDILIYMDRPQFTHNPSSCASSNLVSTMTGAGSDFLSAADDPSSTSTAFFQLLNCRTLGFKPKLGVELNGGTKRRAYPQLTVTFTARGQGDSNLEEIEVSMPHSEFLAQEHIKSICTKVQFRTERCPADSAYGTAVAYTPLFDEPLRGNVYLRSSSKQLPDLVASLYSGAIHIVLEGEIGGTKQGGVRALFKGLPDEPLDKFVMTLNGGKRGLLQNSSNICVEPPIASVRALAQNQVGSEFNTVLRGQCKKGKKKKSKRHLASKRRVQR